MTIKPPVITIDGPVGSGKSTVGRLLAAKLGYTYLDTGAMYRAVALASRERGIAPDDENALAGLCGTVGITFKAEGVRQLVHAAGRDITEAIRAPEISMLASRISALPAVRAALVELQRQLGAVGGIVVDGRDAGTVIFPTARFKFYLDAAVEVRARRRYKELIEKGLQIDYNSLLSEVKKRDHDDSSRSIAPLKPAPDAVIIDTSLMTLEDVLDALASRVRDATHAQCHK